MPNIEKAEIQRVLECFAKWICFLILLSSLEYEHLCAQPFDLNRWKALSNIPNELGVAGAFVGVHNQALVLAGGANFPDKMPWEGGQKVWHDEVYVLESPNGTWKSAGKLPKPIGYGVAISTRHGVVCIGGSDNNAHTSECFLLRWEDRHLVHDSFPSLPVPLANMCGTLVDETLYVAGGLESPNAMNASSHFLALNLNERNPTWRILDTWPGVSRMLAIAASLDDTFVLVSGTSLQPDDRGNAKRIYQRDVFQYCPGFGWKQLADVPVPVVAAPSPAITLDSHTIYVFGGDDGLQVGVPSLDRHLGFSRSILRYDSIANAWSKHNEMPMGQVTTTSVLWNNQIVIPSGEIQPGVRTSKVWGIHISR